MTAMGLNTAAPGTDRPVSLRLLGDFRLHLPRTNGYLPPSAQRLVAFVALHADGVSRGRAAAELWPETTDRRASAGLRSTLWRVAHQSLGHQLIRSARGGPSLHPGVHVDLREAVVRAGTLTSEGREPPRGTGRPVPAAGGPPAGLDGGVADDRP